MEDRAHAFITGVFTLALGLAALLAVWWFGGTHEVTRNYLVVSQQNVKGLNPQAQVRYRGIWVGKVTDINLDSADPRNILIGISIREEVPVTRTTTAKLDYQGVTGIAYILLEDPNEGAFERLPDDGKLYRIAMQPSLIDELSASAELLLKEANLFLHNVNMLFTDETKQAVSDTLSNIATATAELQPIARHLADATARIDNVLNEKNLESINRILSNLAEASGEIKPLIVDARKMIHDIDETGRNIDEFIADLNTKDFASLWTHLDSATQSINRTVRRLGRILDSFEDEPQSLIFGTPPQAPGPGEKGYSPPSN